MRVDGEPISGVAVRLRPLLLPQRARRCSRAARGPYFYLPKMESHLEARLWNDVFVCAAGARSGIPRGTIKATVLIETHPRPRSRWTRSSTSCASTRPASTAAAGTTSSASSRSSANDPTFVLPDRAQVTMDTPFLRAYVAAADPDLPPPRRARDGRHGGADPDQERPGGQRGGAREGARRQAARGAATATTAPGSRIPAWCRSRTEVFDAHMPGAEPARPACARTSTSPPRDLLAVPDGHDHRGRACATTSTSASSTSRRGCAATAACRSTT